MNNKFKLLELLEKRTLLAGSEEPVEGGADQAHLLGSDMHAAKITLVDDAANTGLAPVGLDGRCFETIGELRYQMNEVVRVSGVFASSSTALREKIDSLQKQLIRIEEEMSVGVKDFSAFRANVQTIDQEVSVLEELLLKIRLQVQAHGKKPLNYDDLVGQLLRRACEMDKSAFELSSTNPQESLELLNFIIDEIDRITSDNSTELEDPNSETSLTLAILKDILSDNENNRALGNEALKRDINVSAEYFKSLAEKLSKVFGRPLPKYQCENSNFSLGSKLKFSDSSIRLAKSISVFVVGGVVGYACWYFGRKSHAQPIASFIPTATGVVLGSVVPPAVSVYNEGLPSWDDVEGVTEGWFDSAVSTVVASTPVLPAVVRAVGTGRWGRGAGGRLTSLPTD